MNKKSLLFWLAIAFQLVILGGIIVKYSLVIMNGTQIIAQVEPVDPRDWTRGDYVTLDYKMDRYVTNKGEFISNEPVFVVPKLDKEMNFVGIATVTRHAPSSKIFFKANVKWISENSTFFKIEMDDTGDIVEYIQDHYWGELEQGANVDVKFRSDKSIDYIIPLGNENDYRYKQDANTYRSGKIISMEKKNTISLDYGQDRFFVEEGAGKEIEKQINKDKVYAIWKVSDKGNIVLVGLIVDGKVIY